MKSNKFDNVPRSLNRADYWKLMVLSLHIENLGEDVALQMVDESEFAIANDNMALVRTDDSAYLMIAKDGVITSIKEVDLEIWNYFCESE